MKKNVFLLSIMSFLMIFSSCSLFEKDNDDPDKPTNTGVVHKDILYKTAGGKNLKLDILMPTTDTKSISPVVIFIHGGAWITGNKSLIDKDYIAVITTELRNNGYAVVAVDFRQLLGVLSFPINVSDCKDAVRWIRKNAGTYDLDANSIGLWGTSSGGHIALTVAYSNAEYTDDSNSIPVDLQGVSSSVNYVIDNFAPSNLHKYFVTNTDAEINVLAITNPSTYTDELQMVLDALHVNQNSEYFTAEEMSVANSPINFLSGNVPTLILHGTTDNVVLIDQSEELRDSLISVGAVYEYYEYQSVNHSFIGASTEQTEDIHSKIINFIAKYRYEV